MLTIPAVPSRLTGVDWRQKIENQRGAVLATELKNNANKLAKWTAAALVAGELSIPNAVCAWPLLLKMLKRSALQFMCNLCAPQRPLLTGHAACTCSPGVDVIKLGYVARSHPRDPHHHVVISTQVPTLLSMFLSS